MMDIYQELQLRTRHLSPADILRAMGYSRSETSAKAHYLSILQSPYLGIETEYRDERFGERGFLEALCHSVGIGEADYLPAITSVSERLTEDRSAFRHWLFADTDYVRASGTPLFAMAFTERFRRLMFPIDFWRLPYEERLEAACQKARDHMQESGGKLITWGDIKRYHYCFAEKRSIVISPQGEVTGECSNFDPPKATFGVVGNDENLGDTLSISEK